MTRPDSPHQAGRHRWSRGTRGALAAIAGVLLLTLAPPVGAQQQIDPTWLTFDTPAKTVRFQLIAGLTGFNGALNFNGFRDGELTLVVPVGWKADIAFRNHDGMLSHSAEVIAPQTPVPAQPINPAIPRAVTIKLASGIPPEGTDAMRFTAQPEGEYLIFCGVPGHGLGGMWIRLRVSAAGTIPALLHTPASSAR